MHVCLPLTLSERPLSILHGRDAGPLAKDFPVGIKSRVCPKNSTHCAAHHTGEAWG